MRPSTTRRSFTSKHLLIHSQERTLKYQSFPTCSRQRHRYNDGTSRDRGLKLRDLRGATGAFSRYIGSLPIHVGPGCVGIGDCRSLDTFALIVYSWDDIIPKILERYTMKTKWTIPPANFRNLSILTDAAVCSSNAEATAFIKMSDLDPADFDQYCVYDVTYGIYRIFIEAGPLYMEGS